jgi:hypothetical protein
MDYSIYDYDARIELAIADIEAEKSPIIADIARKWGLEHITLSRR